MSRTTDPARGRRRARRRRRLLEACPDPEARAVAQLDQQVAAEQATLAQTQQLIATYQGARDAYKANYDTVVRLGKAVPTEDDTRSLIVQLDTAAKRSGVSFDTVNVNGGGAPARADGTTIAPGAVSAGAFSAMPFSLNFAGEFCTLGDFFSRLERFVTLKGDQIAVSGRLLRVESIELQPGERRLAGPEGSGRRQLLHRPGGRRPDRRRGRGDRPRPRAPRPRRRPRPPPPPTDVR